MDDVGLAAERAQLARQRTALSLVTSAAVATRFSVEHVGVGVSVLLGVATVLAAWVLITARRDYRDRRPGSSTPRRSPALHLFALSTTVVLIAVAQLAASTRL